MNVLLYYIVSKLSLRVVVYFLIAIAILVYILKTTRYSVADDEMLVSKRK